MEDPLYVEDFMLDAINILLETINEQPIIDPEDVAHIAEAQQAQRKILEAKREVLSEGWDFNTDHDWVFPLGVGGMIPVPTNVLDLTASRADVIIRNQRLYSKSDQSHIFTEEVSADVVWDMDFNTLTHPLRRYVTLVAANLFVKRTIADKVSIAYTKEDIQDAETNARRSESRTGQYNMLTSGMYGINNRVRSV